MYSGTLRFRKLESFEDTCSGLEGIVKEIKPTNEHVLRLGHTSCLSSRKHNSNPVLFSYSVAETAFIFLQFKALHDNMTTCETTKRCSSSCLMLHMK